MRRVHSKSTLVVGAITIGVIAFGSACSLVATFDGFVGPVPTEGGADASLSDGGNASDAPNLADSSAALDGAAADAHATFCATQTDAAFCADFDEGDDYDSGMAPRIDPRGTIALSTAGAVSPPSSMHMNLARRSSGDLEYATLEWGPPTDAWPRVVIDVDVYLDPPAFQGGDINAGIFNIDLEGSVTRGDLNLVVGPTYVQLDWQDQLTDVTNALLPSTWTHLHIDLTPATGACVGTIGSMAFNMTQGIDAGTPNGTYVNIGVLGFNAPAPAFSVYYDNFVATLP